MAESEMAFLGRMLEVFPELRVEYDAKYEEYVVEGVEDGAPALFLEEHTWAMLARYDKSRDTNELMAVADFVEAELGSHFDVDLLIEHGFVVLLPDPQSVDGKALGQRLGPKLSAMLETRWDWRELPNVMAFVKRMTSAVPTLDVDADENTYGRHNDVLVHIFLGDVVRREVENYLSGEQSALDEVRAVFGLLEAEYGHDEDIDEPIAVSFVENLPYPNEPGADIVGLLGPRLTEELLRQWPSRLDQQ